MLKVRCKRTHFFKNNHNGYVKKFLPFLLHSSKLPNPVKPLNLKALHLSTRLLTGRRPWAKKIFNNCGGLKKRQKASIQVIMEYVFVLKEAQDQYGITEIQIVFRSRNSADIKVFTLNPGGSSTTPAAGRTSPGAKRKRQR